MAQKEKIQYKTYQDFSSGLINKFPVGDSRTPITAVVDCQNVDFTEIGTIKKRKGFIQLGDELTDGSYDIEGLHYYGYQNQLLAVCNTQLFKYDFDDGDNASWSAITKTLVAEQKTEFANALTYCWITNNTDTPQRYDGSDMTDSETGTDPDNYRPNKAEFVIFKHNRLFYGDIEEAITDNPRYNSRIRYSGLGAIEGADAWPLLDSSFDFDQDDGDDISGLRAYRNTIVITKNNSLHLLKGTSLVDFGQFTYDTKIGCVANRTIREVEDKLFFLNRKGIYSFDGIEIKSIGENIRYNLDLISQSTLADCCGIYFDNKYIIGSPHDSFTLVYNTLSKTWTKYYNKVAYADDFTIRTSANVDTELYFSYSTGANVRVYQMFTGDEDDGTDISANFITTKFDCDTPYLKKQFHTVWAYAEGNASDSLTINYRLDYDTAWTPFTSTFDLGNKIQKFSFPAGEKHKGRNIQFQVLNTSSYQFEFKGFTLSYEEVYEA